MILYVGAKSRFIFNLSVNVIIYFCLCVHFLRSDVIFLLLLIMHRCLVLSKFLYYIKKLFYIKLFKYQNGSDLFGDKFDSNNFLV